MARLRVSGRARRLGRVRQGCRGLRLKARARVSSRAAAAVDSGARAPRRPLPCSPDAAWEVRQPGRTG